MFFYHLPIAWRIFLKNKRTIGLNIIGLTLGLSLSILLGSYCSHEYHYDAFQEKADRIYQLWATVQMGPNATEINRFSLGTGEEIKSKYPKVISFTRIAKQGKALLARSDQLKSEEQNILFVDRSFFEIFTFPIVNGDFYLADQPNFILISETMGKKYFGNINPIGETLMYNDTLALQVAGVFKDVPENSSLIFDFLISFPTLKSFPNFKRNFDIHQIGLGVVQTYLLLQDQATADLLEERLPKFSEPFKINSYHLEPVNGAHIRNYGGGNQSSVPLFSAIAAFLFFIVILNSANVTASLGFERKKEIVIRKINGAARGSVIYLFYIEAIMLSFISLGLSYGLAILSLDGFQYLFSVTISWRFLVQRPFIDLVVLGFIFMVSAGGLYPVLVLSTTKPILSLISSFKNSALANFARKFSIVLQLVISSVLILGAMLMRDQVSYLEEKDLGLNIKDILVFRLSSEDAINYPLIKHEMSILKGVLTTGASNVSLFLDDPPTVMVNRFGSSDAVALSLMIADPDFFRTMEIFDSKDRLAPGIILNETASQAFSGTKNSTGYQINMGQRPVSVTSVIRDFNFTSLRNKVGNLGITLSDDSAKVFGYTGCYIYTKLESRHKLIATVKEIEMIFKKLVPSKPFSYSFLEETYLSDFRTEQILLKSLSLFTSIAIFISGFGLASLLMFQISNRMVEISIRKVLGASSFEIGYMLFRELIGFLFICAAISIPLSLYFITHWLQSFPSKAAINYSTVLFGFCFVVFIVTIIGFIFVRKASISSPIRFLRKE